MFWIKVSNFFVYLLLKKDALTGPIYLSEYFDTSLNLVAYKRFGDLSQVSETYLCLFALTFSSLLGMTTTFTILKF